MVNSSSRNYESQNYGSDMDIDGAPKPVLRVKESPRGLVLTINHLLMFWSFTAGMMVFVFVIGYHAGRTKGRNALLEDVSRETARLPIVSTMVSGQAQDLLSMVKAQPVPAEEEQKFDFAASEKLPSATDVVVPGWYLQVAASNNISAAQSISKNFVDKKIEAKVKKISLKDKSLFQVLAGPFASRELATQAIPKIKALKISKIEPFALKVN